MRLSKEEEAEILKIIQNFALNPDYSTDIYQHLADKFNKSREEIKTIVLSLQYSNLR